MLTLVGVVLVIIAIVCACMLVFSSKPKLEKLLASSRVSIGDTLKAYHETKASLGAANRRLPAHWGKKNASIIRIA